jgi:hypothetical protein
MHVSIQQSAVLRRGESRQVPYCDITCILRASDGSASYNSAIRRHWPANHAVTMGAKDVGLLWPSMHNASVINSAMLMVASISSRSGKLRNTFPHNRDSAIGDDMTTSGRTFVLLHCDVCFNEDLGRFGEATSTGVFDTDPICGRFRVIEARDQTATTLSQCCRSF